MRNYTPDNFDLYEAQNNAMIYLVLVDKNVDRFLFFEWDLNKTETDDIIRRFETKGLTEDDFQRNDWIEGDFFEFTDKERMFLTRLA